MKIKLSIIILIITFSNLNAQDIPTTQTDVDTTLLGLPGDNLDLYAVLDLFQNSKTIEAFEESLNEEKTGINNLDLNLDEEVDFIKVETKQDKDDFMFVLQVDVLEKEIQDVAVILVSKDKDEKVTVQMVGNEALYGKNYAIEPKLKTEAITANPAYSGADTVVVKSQTSTVVVVESEPIIHYVYSPMYAPYYPPYYYGYYPVYYRPYPVVSITFYRGHHHHHHHHYHGGNNHGGNTVIINNNNKNYNSYNKTKNTSNTVNSNKSNGSYKNNVTSNNTSSTLSKDNKKNSDSFKPESNKNNIKENKSIPSDKNISKPTSKPQSMPKRAKGGGGRRGR